MKRNQGGQGRLWVMAAATLTVFMSTAVVASDDEDRPGDRLEGRAGNEQGQIRRGFEIAPVPLDFSGKSRGLVGLGSYLVNTSGCNDCHTNPNYAKGGDPFMGQPEQINTLTYLAGGRLFGPFVSANITPDKHGKPAGLTREEFKQTLRTGHNPHDPKGEILQVMPWPAFGKKLDRDLDAIYEYLRAIPSRQMPTPSP